MKPPEILSFVREKPPKGASPHCVKVTERYLCEEGEGSTLGARTFLIRLSGCNLRCFWCDSKQSSFFDDEEKMVPAQQLLEEALASEAPWISITGGEPTWRGEEEMKSLAWLCMELRRLGRHTKIESNGLIFPEILSDAFSLWSISPKWDNSKGLEFQRQAHMDYDSAVLRGLMHRFSPERLQLKFVICADPDGRPRQSDFERSLEILESLREAGRAPVIFIPEAYGPGDYLKRYGHLAEALRTYQSNLKGWDWRVQPQWHRVLYGDERGR